MVREIVGLKARLFWNGLRSDRQRQIGLPFILGLIGWLALAVGGRHRRLLATIAEANLPDYLAWAGLICFVAWVALPIIVFPVDENIDPQQLAVLPIPRPTLITGLTGASFVSLPMLGLLWVTLLTLAHDWRAVPFTLIAAAAYLVLLVIGSQALSTVMSAIVRSRRGRDLAMLLVMGIGLASFAGFQAVRITVNRLGVETAVATYPLADWWWLVAPSAPARAIAAAWNGEWLMAAVALVVTAVWIGGLGLIWERILNHMLVTPTQEGSRSTLRGRRGMERGGWSPAVVIARKELRFYLRDPRQRLVWTGTVIFVGLAVAALVVGAEGFIRFRAREWLPLLAPVLVLMVGLPIALNQFGWERNAASYLFALPASPRSLIVGKNLAAAIGLSAETVFLGALFAWFSSWEWIGLVPALAIAAILCLLAVGNVVSVLTPLRLPREGTDMFAQASEQGLLALLSQMISFFMIGLLLVIPASVAVLTVAYFQAIPPWFTVAFALAWGSLWYAASVWVAAWLLGRRVPEVVGWVQVN